MASLKTEMFKALVDPFLREVGTRTGKVLADLIYGKDKTVKPEETPKPEPKKDEENA